MRVYSCFFLTQMLHIAYPSFGTSGMRMLSSSIVLCKGIVMKGGAIWLTKVYGIGLRSSKRLVN